MVACVSARFSLTLNFALSPAEDEIQPCCPWQRAPSDILPPGFIPQGRRKAKSEFPSDVPCSSEIPWWFYS